MEQPVKLAFLWHQHQPYYRAGSRFLMPWTWLHATKDYLEMAQHLERHPKMRAAINLVPSLLKQIEEYLSGEVFDPVVDLMTKPASWLTAAERDFMLDNFFLANSSTVIDRSPRYTELYELALTNPSEFAEQDYRDLAVHYMLAWTGEIARRSAPFIHFINRDRNYSEDDKNELMRAQLENVRQIIPLHRQLAKRGQIELTTSPFYHPILPLLIDSESAKDAMPNMALPAARFQAPEEAELQIRLGREYFASIFGETPHGMWPSEGSISNEALVLMRKAGVRWTASDESVLANSLRDTPIEVAGIPITAEHAKYFPWCVNTAFGPLAVFFRDHTLSDDIGFTYQTWAAGDAVSDFVEKVLQIRRSLVESYGEDILQTACISVILDGENCWEYYSNNGHDLLDKLYSALESNELIEPTTFGDVLHMVGVQKSPVLEQVVAGSWINGNFRIWMGHPEDNLAWDLLARAKHAFDDASQRAEHLRGAPRHRAMAAIERAHEQLLIAEGSDWCWWYGPEHLSTQRNIFDGLFRMHLRSVYVHLDLTVPEELLLPIPIEVKVLAIEKAESDEQATFARYSQAMSRSRA